jgi:DNA polymerase III subunit delta
MKFYPNQLSLIIDGIKNKNIKAILLYGSDKGLISFLCKKMAALFSSTIDLEIDSAEELKYELDAYDLFGNVFLKKIYYKKEFESVIKNINKSNHLHFPVIIADDAKAANYIRILFENDKSLASVGCYSDNEVGVRNLVKSFFESKNKYVSREALEYIISNSSSDRLVILSELEKLFLYTHDKDRIELEDVLSALSGQINFEIDKLCFHFIKKEFDKYFDLLDKTLKNDKVESIIVIRSLIKYYNNFYTVKKSDLSIDEAIKKLSPQIFFSYVNDFKLMEKKLTLDEVVNTLQRLLHAELNIKKDGSHMSLYRLAIVNSDND